MRNIAWSKENISHPWLIWQIIDNFTSLCYHYHYYYYLLLLFFYVADVHEGSFIVFMVCSMIYMFFSCVLLKLTSSQPITTEVCNITLFITIRIVGWGGGGGWWMWCWGRGGKREAIEKYFTLRSLWFPNH